MKKVILMLLAAIAGHSVKAQIPQPDPDTTAKHFLTVASISNLQEVTTGQLAAQKAKRTDVKAFGQMMVKDHGMAEQQLKDLAKQQGIDLQPAATGGVKPDINLEKAGDKFDQLYVHAMVNGHRNTVQTFQNYAVTGKNPAIKAFAQKMLPTLKMHLEQIKTIDKQLEGK